MTPGGTANLTIGAAAVGGFNGQIALSCSATAGLTCQFAPATISPGTSAASSTLTLTAAASSGGGYGGPMALLTGLGVFGTLLTSRGRKGKSLLLLAGLALLTTGMSITTACGSGSSSNSSHQTSTQVNLMVTGTSGAISHSIPVSVTVQ